jgi:anthranilate phosphoribosyltransferase
VELEITPEQAGLRRLPIDQIAGGAPEENAQRLAALLSGRGSEADSAVVALNAGALLMTAGRAAGLREGVGQALDALRSGRANATLQAFVEASRG